MELQLVVYCFSIHEKTEHHKTSALTMRMYKSAYRGQMHLVIHPPGDKSQQEKGEDVGRSYIRHSWMLKRTFFG